MNSLSIADQKRLLKKSIVLMDENLELLKDNEFKDYRIQKLEQEIRDLQKLLKKSSDTLEITPKTPKHQYERIQIYV